MDTPSKNENLSVSGSFHPSFAGAVQAFARLFPDPRFGGGALSVYLHGEPVVDVWTGWADRAGDRPWTANTAALAFSSTKGLTSTIIHRLVERDLLSMTSRWPAIGRSSAPTASLRLRCAT